MAQCEEWIADIQQYSSDKRVGRTMSHHAAALKVGKPPDMSPVGGFKRGVVYLLTEPWSPDAKEWERIKET